MPASTVAEIEAEGLALVARFKAARRAWYCEGTTAVVDSAWHKYLLNMDLEDAFTDIWIHLRRHGEIETPDGGLWVLDGAGYPAYRGRDYRPRRRPLNPIAWSLLITLGGLTCP